MAPSLLKLGATALAAATSVAAQGTKSYQLIRTYDSTNFFDGENFEFFQSKFNTGDIQDIDPSHGFVNYTSKAQAQSLGLIKTANNEVYIGVDSKADSKPEHGRNSVRIEGVHQYDEGLFIATFNHFPKPVCGAWPAFWMYGPDWAKNGEVDVYEGWNMADKNHITAHTQQTSGVGACKLDQTNLLGNIETLNCDINALGQYTNEGCRARENSNLWGNSQGGIYAIQWEEDFIKIWSWPRNSPPSDVSSGKPVPGNWGKPHWAVVKGTCDVKKNFNKMRLVIDITFCGDAADNVGNWASCLVSTGQTCSNYVRNNPTAFADTNWRIKDIKVFKNLPVQSTSSSTSSTASSTSSSASSTSSSASSTWSSASSTSSTASSTASGSASTTNTKTYTPSGTRTRTRTHHSVTGGPSSWPHNPRPSKTSTVFVTRTYTVSSCAPTITNCPYGHVTTSVVAVSTTVCPADDDDDSSWPTQMPSADIPAGWTRSTVYSTRTYTVTSCAPTVTNCPFGRVTTSVVPVGTTICPVDSDKTWATRPASAGDWKPQATDSDWKPQPAGGNQHSGSWSQPQSSGSGSRPQGAADGTAAWAAKPTQSVVTAGSSKMGVSLIGALVGAVLVLML